MVWDRLLEKFGVLDLWDTTGKEKITFNNLALITLIFFSTPENVDKCLAALKEALALCKL